LDGFGCKILTQFQKLSFSAEFYFPDQQEFPAICLSIGWLYGTGPLWTAASLSTANNF
jgi:hypothetical protein